MVIIPGTKIISANLLQGDLDESQITHPSTPEDLSATEHMKAGAQGASSEDQTYLSNIHQGKHVGTPTDVIAGGKSDTEVDLEATVPKGADDMQLEEETASAAPSGETGEGGGGGEASALLESEQASAEDIDTQISQQAAGGGRSTIQVTEDEALTSDESTDLEGPTVVARDFTTEESTEEETALTTPDEATTDEASSEFNVIEGTSGQDTITGTSGRDQIFGFGAKDTLSGAGGDDELYGGPGQDTLRGDEGDDILYGEADADTLYGGTGEDTLIGGEGKDTLYGEAGDDTLAGGAGDDTIYGGIGDDTLTGGAGKRDALFGEEGNDTFIFGLNEGNKNTIDGGAEGSWMDTIRLEGVTQTPTESLEGPGSWVLGVDGGAAFTVDELNQTVTFDDGNASGSITLYDGSQVDFSNIDEIEW